MTTVVDEQEDRGNIRGYMFFWTGQLVSIFGSSVVQFVIAWWLTVRTESALVLSLANVAGFLPIILLSPLAGVIVDRVSKKWLIASVDFFQAVATIGMIIVFKFETQLFSNEVAFIATILGFLVIRGSLQAFHQPAIQALIPVLVPRKHLKRINSLDFLLNSVIFMIGPVVAALLLAIPALEVGDIIWIDAITFVIATIPLVLISIPAIEKKLRQKKEEKPSFRAEFKEGITFIRQKKGLLPLLGAFTATNLFITPLFTLFNLFLYSEPHYGTETNLAMVMVMFQAGMLGGSVIMLVWGGFKKKVIGVAGGILVAYVGYLITSLTPAGTFWLMGLGLLILGLALPVLNISSQTIWQTVVPKDKLGRVMAVRITIAQMSAPLGMILAGVIAEFSNTIFPIYVSCVGLGLVFLAYSWFFTGMKNVEEDIIYDDEKKPTVEADEMVSEKQQEDKSAIS
ncbi:MAG: MFS transporter [Candidatus Heimdallarchaeaceae archaeon]